MSSVFTKILAGDLPGHFIYDDQHCAVFLSINPITPGHALVVPREEISHWLDVPPEVNAHMMGVAQKLGQAQMKVFSPARVGMIIAGFEVPHTHLHVVPINRESELSFANAASTVDHGELAAIAAKLKLSYNGGS